MDIEDWLQRMFDEEEWRKQKAMKMAVPQSDPSRDASGAMTKQFPRLGVYTDGLPLSLKDHFANRYPDFDAAARDQDGLGLSPGNPYVPLNKARHVPIKYKGYL